MKSGYFSVEQDGMRLNLCPYPPPTMKKTPADFAAAPAHNALQVVVALTALAGIASNMIPKAQAADASQATYSAETQKSQLGSLTNVYTSTNGNIQTSSRGYGGFISSDDNNGYTDSDY